MKFDEEDYILFFEMLSEEVNHTHLNFDKITKIFYFGKSLKYGIPHSFLIVTNELDNKYVEYEFVSGGTSGNCLKRTQGPIWDPQNRKNWWNNITIHTSVFNKFPLDQLASKNWIYDSNPFKNGTEVDFSILRRISRLAAFL